MTHEPVYELHYSTGGHGGPHATVDEAIAYATRLVNGNERERYIHVHRGVNGPIVATVARVVVKTDEIRVTRYKKGE